MTRPDKKTTNDAELRRWNDDRWTSSWPQREALTNAITPSLLDALDPRDGEHIVDVGSGGGLATMEIARRVAPTGSVLGVDISNALVQLARQRAHTFSVANASFALADAQVDPIPGGPFDKAASQFGVMFFDDPVTAFRNIRAQLRRGGQLVFACWQRASRNPWHVGTVLRPLLPAENTLPNAQAPGPFRLGDAEETAAILHDAEFDAIGRSEHELFVEAPSTAVFDRSQMSFYGVPDEQMDEATHVVNEHLATFEVAKGRYRFPLAFSIVSATNS